MMPAQIMGLAFIFRLDESSLAGHVGERAPRTAADTESVAITEAGKACGRHRSAKHVVTSFLCMLGGFCCNPPQ